MSAIAEVRLPSDELVLHETLTSVRDAEFHAVRLAAHDGGVLPLLWATSRDRRALYRALDRDPTTDSVDVLSEVATRSLLRVEWAEETDVLASIVEETDVTVLDASARGDAWFLELFCPNGGSASTIHDVCDDHGVGVTLERISQLSETDQADGLGLTEEQYEAVREAYEAGYYDVPRKVSQEELADSFDVSRQALSERLRRGHSAVIANTLGQSSRATDDPPALRYEAGISN
jgi:predicted DNA binding protein